MKMLGTDEGRKAFALLALLGGATSMTIYAAVVLYLVRMLPGYAFWLGLAAHGQIVVIFTGFIAFFVKRKVTVGKEGVSVDDEDSTTT